ncbi:MAG: DUF86 domain-containing protein [Bacteroidetes bacterium]|nr:DUF86 domain-containing protein [Bacteroidota bacterium]
MHRISHRDFSCIQNILESINKIQEYSNKFENADEFFDNTISFDASMMNFIVIGEMVDKLSSDFLKKTENDINWFKVKGFRNIIAHNYFGIDAEEVWQIIQDGLKDLKFNLEKEIN